MRTTHQKEETVMFKGIVAQKVNIALMVLFIGVCLLLRADAVIHSNYQIRDPEEPLEEIRKNTDEMEKWLESLPPAPPPIYVDPERAPFVG
jgi:hypothetical protein